MAGLMPSTQRRDAIRLIAELLKTLPQELYDMIYKRTFRANPDGVVSLKDGNAFPSLLHVDRQTRETFAESFYSNTTLTFGGKMDRPANAQVVDLWAQRIATHHLGYVKKLILKIDTGYGDTNSYRTDPKAAADV